MSSHKPVVLITGANTGLGYATVKALCQSPIAYIILLCGRDLEKAKEAVNKLQEECPSTESQVVPQHVDVEDDSSIEKLAQEVEKEYGRVDVLINNAGTSSFLLSLDSS
jgi:NAD(P)-dependent dehydrogenase (short-subunit alcohol dehydrogenase family)